MTTSSPGFHLVTPSPTLHTTPEASEPPMWWPHWGWSPYSNTDTGFPSEAQTLLKLTPAAITRTITSNAPGSGTSISSSLKASFGSPSRSWRITHAAIVSGRVPGSTSSLEASEKPQLPLDETAEGVVRALADRLVIERLTVTDERASRVVRERAEAGQGPARTVADAIEIGARVIEREGTAAEVDYVRAEFERHAAELRERLTRSLERGDEQLAERISESFDGAKDGSVQKD